MADRTVRVVLTGNVTPYVSAMRTAAAQTQAASRQIASSSQAAANSSSSAFQRMGTMATTQAGRASSAVNRAVANTSTQMNQLAARSTGAMSQMNRAAAASSQQAANSSTAAFQQMARMAQTQGARAAAALNTSFASTRTQANALGVEGSAALNRVGASAINAASAMRNSMTSAAASSTQAINSTSAALARMSTLAQTGAVASASALNASAAATTAQMAGLGAASAAAMNRATAASVQAAAAVRGAGAASSAAAAATTSRWASAWMALSGGARFAASTVGTSMMQVANNSERTLKTARGASLALVATFLLAAAAAARFDKAMSEVRAVTSGSADEMKKLSDAALAASRSTIYSASQAANAEAELARAGISTADIIGGALKGSLDLAASGQLELGESAIISAQAMNAFRLSGQDVGHIADVISAGAGKSATNVHHLGMAFRQAALLSSQTGLSLEQTVGTLALFAQNALTGSDAGTSLKVMLQRLVPQSKEAAGIMDQLGFSAYDAQGEFIGLTNLAGMMQKSFSQLTPEARNAAMATIFGSDAVRAATILYQAGASGVDSWVSAVNDSGYATRVASEMTNNLSGDLSRLKNSLEAALIESGSSANAALRDLAQGLTEVVNWYNQLSPAMQQSVTVGAGLVGMLGLVGSGLLLLLPRIMLVRRELVALGLTAARTRMAMLMLGRMGLVVAGVAAVSYGVNKLTSLLHDAPPNVTKLANSLVDLGQKGNAAGELTKAFGSNLDGFGEAVARIAHPGNLDRVSDFFSEFDVFGPDGYGDLIAAREKVKSLDEALAGLVQGGASKEAASAFARMAAEAEKQGTSVEKLRSILPQYSEALSATDTQNKLTAGSQKALSDAAARSADEIADTRTEAEKLTDSLKSLNGVTISAAEKEIAFRSSLKGLTDTVKENGLSLDVASEKGRAVRSSFLDAAQGAMAHAQAVAEQKNSVDAGNAVLEQDIALLRQAMVAAGFTATEINKLVGEYARLPTDVSTDVSAPGAVNAANELSALSAKLVKLPAGKSVTVTAPTAGAIRELEALGYKVAHLPDGRVSITAPTGSAVESIGYLQARIDALRGKTIDITTHYRTTGRPAGSPYPPSGGRANREANGGYIRGYAAGGDVQFMPVGGAVYGPGTPTSDSVPTWLSTGEYVIKAASVRKYGRTMMDRLNAGRYASGGYAGGGFTYAPAGLPALGGTRDGLDRYNTLVAALRDAWSDYRQAMTDLNRVRNDKKSSTSDRNDAYLKVIQERTRIMSGNRGLGQAPGAGAPVGLNLALYQKQLSQSLAATETWRASLNRIGGRGGQEIRDLLEGMGEEGYELVNQLVGASDQQFRDIVDKLKRVAGVAKATLGDFTGQLNASTAKSQQFASDLQTLAARGFGDLAQMLASQGDQNAVDLARQAVTGSAGDTAKANAAAKQSSGGLSGDDLAASLTLLSALRAAPGRGIADVISAGLPWSTIRDLAPKIMGRINGLPPEFRQRFVSQLVGQGVIPAMARGGILTAPAVLAGEGGPEAWIPLNGSSRSRALLGQTARLMGYDARPAGAFGGAGGSSSVRHGDRTTHITLNGARQSSAEQLQDLARHLQFAG